MARVLCLALVMAVLVGTSGIGRAEAPKETTDRAIVALGVVEPHSGWYMTAGTAFHVGRGFFYTNAHVTRDLIKSEPAGYRLAVVQALNSGIPDTVLGRGRLACVDSRWKDTGGPSVAPFDVSLVHITELLAGRTLPPVLTPSTAEVGVGQRVRVIGFPGAVRFPVRFEMRGEVVEISQERMVISASSGAVIPGSSGSPVMNESGGVVGIIYGTNVARGLSVAVPMATAVQDCAPR